MTTTPLMMVFESCTVQSVVQSVVKSIFILSKAFTNFFSSIFISESYYLIGCQDADGKSTRIVRLARAPLAKDWAWFSGKFSLQGTAPLLTLAQSQYVISHTLILSTCDTLNWTFDALGGDDIILSAVDDDFDSC